MPLKQLTQPLLDWYAVHARDLPWRHTDDPYRIWVSEIMLQQTRVAAVLGYYDRFLKAFPTVQELAKGDSEQLMKLWEGLGYYSRARNLQKAAQVITHEYDGQFPADVRELLKLPGIGEYTAGAIGSAAFGIRVPAVDGNVMRVVSRIAACQADIADPKSKKLFTAMVQEILPEDRNRMRVFNQALMELGATVCVPNGAPKCQECPASRFCLANQRGLTELLPVKTPKKKRRVEEKTVFVLVRDGKLALRKREASGLLAGLWEFPNVEGTLTEQQVYGQLEAFGLRVTDWRKQLGATHIFTHVEWHMTGYVLDVTGVDTEGFFWAGESGLEQCAIPSAFLKFTQEARQILQAN